MVTNYQRLRHKHRAIEKLFAKHSARFDVYFADRYLQSEDIQLVWVDLRAERIVLASNAGWRAFQACVAAWKDYSALVGFPLSGRRAKRLSIRFVREKARFITR